MMNSMQLISEPAMALLLDNFGCVTMRSTASSQLLKKQIVAKVFTDKEQLARLSSSKSSNSRRRNWSVSKAPRCVLASEGALAAEIPTQRPATTTKLCLASDGALAEIPMQPAATTIKLSLASDGELAEIPKQQPPATTKLCLASDGAALAEIPTQQLATTTKLCVLASDGALAEIPTQVPATATKLCVLLVCDAFNSMAQRAWLKLRESGHEVILHVFNDGNSLIAAVENCKPDVILCPFLTKRIPRAVYSGAVPCLVIHPGIEGDRGMSSIDWALRNGEREWGVTILQAEEEMDAGPIWATSNFLIRPQQTFGIHSPSPPTKSSLYRIECIDAAMRCIDVVLHNLTHNVPPRLLDYSNQNVRGMLRPKLRQADRHLNWELPAAELARIIRAGDSQPGTLSLIENKKFLLFGSHVESNPPAGSTPMEILGQRNGAVLIRCGGGTALWITHLKKNVKSIKLPAVAALNAALVSTLPQVDAPPLELSMGIWPQTFQEIFYWTKNDVTYLWFDFYNGAMSTDQCRRLTRVLDQLDRECTSKVLVFMGGINYFSNGIHLNTIEAAVDPAQESWENINAMDDVVLRILTCSKRVSVVAMMGNAGAGGCMMAIAADEVWAHGNVVMYPSYKPMELFGSEYWTHSLPKRTDDVETTTRLVASVDPVSVAEAKVVGLVDEVLAPSSDGFLERVIERAEKISEGKQWGAAVGEKQRGLGELEEKLRECRHRELVQMKVSFESEIYHQKRRDFVYKSAGTLSCQAELIRPLSPEGPVLASDL